MSSALVRRWLAATVLVAAAGVGTVAPTAPAVAASCADASGVTVVVDPHGLGGAVQSVCDASGGGKSAATLFTRNGFALTYVQRQPGFVCRVDGAPASDPCVNTPPADAYWGLFWSDGESGSWTYASVGVAGLTIPDGGYVALSWQGGSSRALPGVAPTAHASASPSPSASPSRSGGGGGGHGGSGGGGHGTAPSDSPTASPSASVSPSASASSSPSAERTRKPKPSRRPSDSEAAGVAPSSDPSSSAAGVTDAETEPAAVQTTAAAGLPAWVVPGVLALLALVAGVVALRRRSRGAPPS